MSVSESIEEMPESPSWRAATDILIDRLIKLDATGSSGFEGLMRDMLMELTGLRFSLAKSGHQSGSDVRSEPSNFFKVGLEAKRYQKGSSLPVDQLKAKIIEAARSHPPVDVWVLAASRTISISDQEVLHEFGNEEGVKTIVFDWDDQGANPPVLAVALAGATETTKAHLGSDSSLTDALSEIKSATGFDGMLTSLRSDISAADAGYVSATQSAMHWLKEAQGSKSRALSNLRGHHELLAPSMRLITRIALEEALDSWWGAKDPCLAMLGDEGTGKSWAALSWVSKLAEAEHPPLTIFLSAKDVQGDDAVDTIARQLQKMTGLRGTEFWKQRLSLWNNSPETVPVLVVLDGLNQNWSKRNWVDFLQPLLDDRNRIQFRVLATCWPDWWAGIGELESLVPSPKTLPVGNFTDGEVATLIEAHGLDKSDFAGDLINLIKVPRLFTLALLHKEELAQSGDITAERLAFEDWKHRLRMGSARPGWSDAEFRDFIANLGNELRANFETATVSTRQLLEQLGQDSGADEADLRVTIQDMVAGRWLQKTDQPNRYRLNREIVPFALGLALAAQLRASDGFESANAQLADFLDPYRGQSLGVAVIRAATTVALLDPSVNADARRALLLRWLSEQNFRAVDFEAWWRLVGADTELFCALIEDQWLNPDRRGSVSEDEVFIKGLANAYDFETAAPIIRNTLVRWLSWVWPNPDEGQFIGRLDPNSRRAQENRAMVVANIEQWMDQSDRSDWPEIHYMAEGNVSWLSHRVFGILSFLPRAPMVRAYEAWAISRSILGWPRHFDELAWLFRINQADEAKGCEMLRNVVDRLLSRSQVSTNQAAIWLLKALGDRQSLELAAEIETEFRDGELPASIAQQEVGRSHLNPSFTPEIESNPLPDGSDLWLFQRSQREADHRFKEALPLYCRSDPSRIRDTIVEALADVEQRTNEQLAGIAAKIRTFVLLLRSDERSRLSEVLRQRAEDESTGSEYSSQFKRAAGILELWGQTTVQQFAHLASTHFEAETLEGMLDALAPMQSDEIQEIRELLPSSADEDTTNVVCAYLLEAGAEEAADEWDALPALVLHENESVRHRALRVAFGGKSKPALRRFAESGWTAAAQSSREERAYGSLALSYAADITGDPSLLRRADPEIWGWRLQNVDEEERNIDLFHSFLKNQVLDVDRSGPRTLPTYAWSHAKATKRLVELRESELLSWFSPWLNEHAEIPSFVLFDSFPLKELARALIEKGLPEGIILWEKLMRVERHGIHKDPELLFLPIYSPVTTDLSKHGNAILDSTITDARLRDLAFHATKAQRCEWLADQVRADVMSEFGGRQARGWKLLGYCSESDVFVLLWDELDVYRPTLDWLREVADASELEFKRNLWAKHWYTELLSTNDMIDAFASYQLMQLCIDRRCQFWMSSSEMRSAPLRNQIKPYWRLNGNALNQGVKDRKKEEKDRLYGLQTMRQTQAPWS